jgi:hypothetical protein
MAKQNLMGAGATAAGVARVAGAFLEVAPAPPARLFTPQDSDPFQPGAFAELGLGMGATVEDDGETLTIKVKHAAAYVVSGSGNRNAAVNGNLPNGMRLGCNVTWHPVQGSPMRNTERAAARKAAQA